MAERDEVIDPDVEDTCARAGWFPGRSVDTTRWEMHIKSEGFQALPTVKVFLQEFGGLSFSGMPGKFARHRYILNPLYVEELIAEASTLATKTGYQLNPIGEVDGIAFLFMDERSRFYLWAGSRQWYEHGRSVTGFLNTAIKPERKLLEFG